MLKRILVADVGSTFTNVSLLEVTADGIHIIDSSASPTTVSGPGLDVMVGVKNAVEKLQERTGITFICNDGLLSPSNGSSGVDCFVSTCSAGGGLKVLAAGLSDQITVESAQRAALGAGAIVTDVLSLNQAAIVLENIRRVQNTPYDMILVTGGTDGGNVQDVLDLVEFLCLATQSSASTSHRKLPFVYAGNKDAQPYLEDIVHDSIQLICVDNVRPSVEKESLDHVHEVIQELFLQHAMSSVPGFADLASWAQDRIKPTPVSIGEILGQMASKSGDNILAVDIGGATTDVFSFLNGQFFRSASANAGMSKRIGSATNTVRPDLVARWLPKPIDEAELLVRNWLLNKTLRPSTLPQTADELMLEQSFAREAIRLSLNDHKQVAKGLRGIKIQRQIGDVFTQSGTADTLLNLMDVGRVIGLGGVLAKAPRPAQAMSVILDGLEPEGVTNLYVDTGSFLPYAGLLYAGMMDLDAFWNMEPLKLLATCIAPLGPRVKKGTVIATVALNDTKYEIVSGRLALISLGLRAGNTIEISPRRDFDVGAGRGNVVRTLVPESELGLVLDGRSRPLALPDRDNERVATLRAWYESIDAYPDQVLHSTI